MAITYPLTVPSQLPTSCKWMGVPVVGMSQSGYSLAEQVQVWSGQQWRCEISFPRKTRANSAALQAFLLKLNGCEGTFLYGDPRGGTPRGSGDGSPVVEGAGQTGNELDTSGWTFSASGVLLEGDYIQLSSGANARLHMVLEDVDADASGNATILIWPNLRESPTDASPVVINGAKGVFRMDGNQSASWDEAKHYYDGISFKAHEVI